MTEETGKKRGRPPGTSPHGNAPGSDGNPAMLLRLLPEEMAQVRARGGQAWVKALIREALKSE